MGHSMGTVLSAHLASLHDEVKGMVMLAPAYDIPDRRLLATSILRYVMPWFYPLKMRSLRPLVNKRLLDFDPTLDLNDPAVQARLPELTKVPTSGIDEMRKIIKMGQKLWPTLNLPSIILQGDEDEVVALENSQTLYGMLPSPDKELIILEGAGHELMRPFDPAHERVWPAVFDFVRQRSRLPVTSPAC